MDTEILIEKSAPPPALQRPPIDFSLLPDLPAFERPGPWTPEHVLEFLPDGACGLDGHEGQWLAALHYDSLVRLARLLDAAGEGRLHRLWANSRFTLIPKGPDSPPSERRPLAVMPTTYRLWAKRHAAELTRWLMQWKPAGLAGAVPGHSCPYVLWQLQADLAKARLGSADPCFVLSMDLGKCFDRLDLGNLQALSRHLGLDVCMRVGRPWFPPGCGKIARSPSAQVRVLATAGEGE